VSLNRYAKTRDKAEPAIVKALRDYGASVVLVDRPTDLIVGYQGRTFLLEVKNPEQARRPGRGLTPPQIEFHRSYKGCVHVVSTPEEAVGVLVGRRYEADFDEIRFVCFSQEDLAIYQSAL